LLERTEDMARSGGEAAKQASAMIATFKKLRAGDVATGSILDVFGERSPASYWLELRNYQPGAVTAKLQVPALIMLAGHDAQVPHAELQRWKTAVAAKRNATLKYYAGLFHLFIPSTGKDRSDTPEDWTRAGHVDAHVVDDSASWIMAQSN